MDGAVGPSECQRAVASVEREPPAGVVDEVVVAVAERYEVGEVGEPVELPEPDVAGTYRVDVWYAANAGYNAAAPMAIITTGTMNTISSMMPASVTYVRPRLQGVAGVTVRSS